MTARENVLLPLELAGHADAGARATSSSRPSASPSAATTTPPSSPAASSSAWRSRAPSARARRSSSPTSRPGTSTARPAPRSSTSSSTSGARAARRSSSSPTTPPSPPSPTAGSTSATGGSSGTRRRREGRRSSSASSRGRAAARAGGCSSSPRASARASPPSSRSRGSPGALEETIRSQARPLLGADLAVESLQPFPPAVTQAIEAIPGVRTRTEDSSPSSSSPGRPRPPRGPRPRSLLVELKAVEPPYPLVGELRLDPDRPLGRPPRPRRDRRPPRPPPPARRRRRRGRLPRRRPLPRRRDGRLRGRPPRRLLPHRPARLRLARGSRADERSPGSAAASRRRVLLNFPEGTDAAERAEDRRGAEGPPRGRSRHPRRELARRPARAARGDPADVPLPRPRRPHLAPRRRRRGRADGARLDREPARRPRDPPLPRRHLARGDPPLRRADGGPRPRSGASSAPPPGIGLVAAVGARLRRPPPAGRARPVAARGAPARPRPRPRRLAPLRRPGPPRGPARAARRASCAGTPSRSRPRALCSSSAAALLLAGVGATAWVQSGLPRVARPLHRRPRRLGARPRPLGARAPLARHARPARAAPLRAPPRPRGARRGPGAGTVSSILALGLGTLVVLHIALVQRDFSRQLAADLPANAPTAFLLDVQPDQWPGVAALLSAQGATPGRLGAGRHGAPHRDRRDGHRRARRPREGRRAPPALGAHARAAAHLPDDAPGRQPDRRGRPLVRPGARPR